jgi:hypothetical protein
LGVCVCRKAQRRDTEARGDKRRDDPFALKNFAAETL